MTSSSRYGRGPRARAPEVLLGRAVRRPVVVREVEVGDAEVESASQDRAAGVERPVVPEVLPEPERDRRKLQAAASTAAVEHAVVAVSGGRVAHDLSREVTAWACLTRLKRTLTFRQQQIVGLDVSRRSRSAAERQAPCPRSPNLLISSKRLKSRKRASRAGASTSSGRSGSTSDDAFLLTVSRVDLHAARTLVEVGCSLPLALRILL